MNDTMYKEKTLQIFSSSEKKETRENRGVVKLLLQDRYCQSA